MLANFVTAISVERSIEGKVLSGEEIKIEIAIELEYAEPSSMIVTEEIPEGWEVVNSLPNVNEFEGTIKWLLYGSKLKDSMKLRYTLKAPADFEETVSLSGQWQTLTEKAVVTGEKDIMKAEPAPVEPQEPDEPMVIDEPEVEEAQDYTLYILGAIVLIVLIGAVAFVLKKKK